MLTRWKLCLMRLCQREFMVWANLDYLSNFLTTVQILENTSNSGSNGVLSALWLTIWSVFLRCTLLMQGEKSELLQNITIVFSLGPTQKGLN